MGSKLDWFDVSAIVAGICFAAYKYEQTPAWIFVVIVLWVAQFLLRRSDFIQTIAQENMPKQALPAVTMLLPSKDTTAVVPYTANAAITRASIPVPTESWADRITGANAIPPIGLIDRVAEVDKGKESRKLQTLRILQTAPRYISYTQIPEAPSKTSILLGYDILQKTLAWTDLATETIHGLVVGATGSGKDSVLRLWYAQLTSNNTPEEIQFVVLDGKGEWLTPALLESPYMLTKPAGGVEMVKQGNKWVDIANERIEGALNDVFELMNERQKLFQNAHATNLVTYKQRTGKNLPLIIIIATDVGTNIQQQLGMLINVLSTKGRSFGFRLLISMQTASKQDTGWRGQLGLVMSGYQQQASADGPNMGLGSTELQFRPSDLYAPDPSRPETLGLFVTRQGTMQRLIKAVHLPDTIFEDVCERHVQVTLLKPDPLLSTLLLQPQTEIIQQSTRDVLTKDQKIRIVRAVQAGKKLSAIMTDELGFTSGPQYKEMRPHVKAIIELLQHRGIG